MTANILFYHRNKSIVNLSYAKVSLNGKSIEKLDKTEEFKIFSFKVQDNFLDSNDLKLVSKGEIVEESDITLQSLPKNEHVKGYRYLFTVSSEYIDSRDTNLRGVLNIPTLDTFTKNIDLFSKEEIVLEEIQEGLNNKINSMYPEIEEMKKQHIDQLEKLKKCFFLMMKQQEK